MQNFASINGNGKFTLKLNDTLAQTIEFTSDKKDAIVFDFAALARSADFGKFFIPGREVRVEIALADGFTPNKGETKDFRVNYAFDFKYYDVSPEAVSSVLGYSVTQSFLDSALGSDRQKGKVFSYKIRLQNNKVSTIPTPVPVDNKMALMPPYDNGGLGMVLAVLRVPACL